MCAIHNQCRTRSALCITLELYNVKPCNFMPAGSFSVSITKTEHFWIQCNRSNDYYQLQSFVNMSSNEDKRKKVDEAVIDDSMKCSDCGMYPCSNQFCLRDDAVIDDSMKSRLLIPPEFPGIPLNSFLWEFKGRKPRFPFRGTPKGTRRKISGGINNLVSYVWYISYVIYFHCSFALARGTALSSQRKRKEFEPWSEPERPCEQRCVNRLSPLSQYTTS